MYKDIRLCGSVEGDHINDLHGQISALENRLSKIERILVANHIVCHFCEICGEAFADCKMINDPACGINAAGNDGVTICDYETKDKPRHSFCWRCLLDALNEYPTSETNCTIAFWILRYGRYKMVPMRGEAILYFDRLKLSVSKEATDHIMRGR